MREHSVSEPMLASERDNLGGRQTRSSLQIGAISTLYVYLKLAVLVWVSEERSCSDAFELSYTHRFVRYQASGEADTAHRIGTTLPRKSTIFIAWLLDA